MRYILDTNVLVGAVRSPKGASAELLRRAFKHEFILLCSVPLYLEYEAVLTRPEHLLAGEIQASDVHSFLDDLARVITPVDIQFLWRPQLRDPADDMVLEAAVNGQANAIVTFNQKDFLPQAQSFGLRIMTPQQYFQGVHHGNS